MTAVLAPNPRQRYFDGTGNPLSGGKLYSYQAGSSTLLATYSDSTGNTPNANPVILDANGEANIWLPANTGYKFRLADANDVTQWTVDNITVSASQDITVSQWIASNATPTYVTPASFSVAGDKRDTFQVNRRTQATCTAGTLYGTISAASYANNVTTVTVTLDSGALDNGLSIVNVGLLTPLNDALPRIYADKPYVDTAVANKVNVPTRQTVLTGSVDSNGQANFLGIGSGLSVNLAATTTPVVVAFAEGFDAAGEVDYVGRITADVSSAWGGLAASATNFLYIDRNTSTGALTYGATTLAPAYQYGGNPSTGTGQHTFRIDQMTMYVGNGSTSSVVQRVFVGEAVTNASSVTSVTAYALRGRYDSGRFAISASSTYAKAHNIGTTPRIFLKGATSAGGALADFRAALGFDGTNNYGCGVYGLDHLSVTVAASSYPHVVTGINTVAVAVEANLTAERGW
jgi:hypothetical protein